MDDAPGPIIDLSYELALAELERIVAALETEEQSLESAIRLYERGQQLSQHCVTLLDQADLRIRTLGEPDAG